jgi:cbb3-type cytochrome oxidase maturation protein
MEVMLFLVPLALLLGLFGLVAFLWSLKSGQFDDLDGAAWRAIADDDDEAPSLQPLNCAAAVDAAGSSSAASIDLRKQRGR